MTSKHKRAAADAEHRIALAHAIWRAAAIVGRKPPLIADRVIAELAPKTKKAAYGEGVFGMLRIGVMATVRAIIKAGEAATAEDIEAAERIEISEQQRDFSEICKGFEHIIATLTHVSYFVETEDAFYSIPELVQRPDWLDDARKYMRRKGQETIAEADRLDALYFAVIGKASDETADA